MKNNFLRGALVLCLGGFITKILGFIIKIMYTRTIGTEGLALYTLIMPIYSLIVTIAGFGMPIAISKLVAEAKTRSKVILSQGIIILLILNFTIMLLVILCSDFIANFLLNEPQVKILIIGAVLAMPQMALACVFKGYFYGKQRMLPNTISNIIEQTIRIIFIIFFLPYFVSKSIILGILSFLLINILTETASILTFMFLLPKNIKINITDIKYNSYYFKDLLFTSIPLVSSRIIGNIGYFFEPIVLSKTMLFIGYTQEFFLLEYGIYNGYSIALLLMPSFLIQALCTALIPEISKFKSLHNNKMIKKRTKEALFSSFLLGLVSTIIVVLGRNFFLNLIYNTSYGADYIFYLGFFFPLYYLEAPLSSILQALGYGTYALKTTTLGVIIKLASMFIFTLFHIGLYGLVISEAIDIIFVVVFNMRLLLKYFNSNKY
ncbi:MAG: oligosaccharide flippase family protein [Bacilli bacterium]